MFQGIAHYFSAMGHLALDAAILGAALVLYLNWSKLFPAKNVAAPGATPNAFFGAPPVGFFLSLLGNFSGLSTLLTGLAGGLWSVLAAVITALPALLSSPLGAFLIAAVLFGSGGYIKGVVVADAQIAAVKRLAVNAANAEADKAIEAIRKNREAEIAAIRKKAAETAKAACVAKPGKK